MKLEELLLYLCHLFREERTVSAPYHLLKGKKSGQTIQDVGLFSLYPYFGILPKLQRATYDRAIQQLIDQQMLVVQPDGYYQILHMPEQLQTNILYFDGWHYRGNETIFFARVSLAVQTLSQQQAGDMRFIPLQKDDYVQRFVRDFLTWAQYSSGVVGTALKDELTVICEHLTPERAQLLLQRLAGASISGYSWAQLAQYRNESPLETQLAFTSVLHECLALIATLHVPLLQALAQNIRMTEVVTSSAAQTANYFYAGDTIEQIAAKRRLKTSTIEDHLIEMAMNDVNFPFEQFVSEDERASVLALADQLQTKKLRQLKEHVPQLSYFQLRLILAKGGKA
ncbi:helix-turn-helix domain-containing protein [Caryophanon tenue]|uniref:Helicase Helix-turn-helix domain-containing protein n=1 Tax=Caryophanon tenue TaxID=33978 RepID=A0A1C0YKU4_9BACL|nr:helix-turn-helix domain-containing protein [Caryophanon tenue]OCS87797.1 hypothetical protein A6M13_10890 [Caryophanon tenue]